jgi:hypothetical protein
MLQTECKHSNIFVGSETFSNLGLFLHLKGSLTFQLKSCLKFSNLGRYYKLLTEAINNSDIKQSLYHTSTQVYYLWVRGDHSDKRTSLVNHGKKVL